MLNCSHCDAQYLRWQGRCNECGKWGTIAEDGSAPQAATSSKKKGGAPAASVLDLAKASSAPADHIATNIDELDRVLSGGLVGGSVTLLAGEPGIGKSTLIAQLAASLSGAGKAYYVSGEESEGQVSMRLKRLGIDPSSIAFSNTTRIGSITAAAKKLKPKLVVVDSIQTMFVDEVDSLAGTPTSVRASTAELISFAKSSNTPVVIIGQVTKEGSVAGPKTLEHLVDTVLTLEGDRQSSYRLLRAGKNRFGGIDEVGIFEMTEAGMTPVANPSATFLEERSVVPGSVITCIMEGTRPILIEVQALAEKSLFANPIRRTSGFDSSRLQMLLAIINKRTKTKVAGHDVYVNVIGGMKVKEHAADLAVCAAIMSSVGDKPMPKETVVFGELGLGGEVRSVPFSEKRTKEAKRLGFTQIISPHKLKRLGDLSF